MGWDSFYLCIYILMRSHTFLFMLVSVSVCVGVGVWVWMCNFDAE